MSLKDEISEKVSAYMNSKYDITDANVVPDKQSIGFGAKAKKLWAVVMYVDLRDSRGLLSDNPPLLTCRTHKAFLYAASKCIREQKGELRSFNGDSVLSFFRGDDAAKRAVKAAMKTKCAVVKIINPILEKKSKKKLDFGIGIGQGDILVVKSGVAGDEIYQDLIWIGWPTYHAFEYGNMARSRHNIWISKNIYITVAATTTGGQSIRYLRDNFSQVELETERILGVDSYDLLNLQAEKVPAGSEGLIVLPYLMGERTPIWDVNARGLIFGLSLNHTKGHIVRAIMEAVAYALYDSYRLIKDADIKIKYPLVLNEGGAKSNLWRKIITDVFNVPTVLVSRRTGAPFGDAILAGVATGIFGDFLVAKEWAEYIDPMEPCQDNHERYMEYFALYKRIYEHVKADFKELARLRDES